MSRPPAAASSSGLRARPCRASRYCGRGDCKPIAVDTKTEAIRPLPLASRGGKIRNHIRNTTEEAPMNLAELNKVAEAMVAPGRGILAADESSVTIKKRFDAIGAESTADNRRH